MLGDCGTVSIWLKRFIERSWDVCVQIVHRKRYFFRSFVLICNLFQKTSPVPLGFSFGDFHHALSCQWFKGEKNIAGLHNVWIRGGNTKRDTRFHSNKNLGTSAFEHYLKKEGIWHIPSRKGMPQTKGKLERLWQEYNRHRWRFESIEAFLKLYNNRIHGALDYFNAEIPQEAFLRICQPESIIGRLLKGGDIQEKVSTASENISVLHTNPREIFI